jgi:DNA gyrase/topoisomerase IV subunit A
MDKNLPLLYRDYGQYSNYRNFPLDIDGLKPVERRVLLSAYKIARQKYVNCTISKTRIS